MTDKKDPTNAARQQTHRNKQKKKKPVISEIIAKLRDLLAEYDGLDNLK